MCPGARRRGAGAAVTTAPRVLGPGWRRRFRLGSCCSGLFLGSRAAGVNSWDTGGGAPGSGTGGAVSALPEPGRWAGLPPGPAGNSAAPSGVPARSASPSGREGAPRSPPAAAPPPPPPPAPPARFGSALAGAPLALPGSGGRRGPAAGGKLCAGPAPRRRLGEVGAQVPEEGARLPAPRRRPACTRPAVRYAETRPTNRPTGVPAPARLPGLRSRGAGARAGRAGAGGPRAGGGAPPPRTGPGPVDHSASGRTGRPGGGDAAPRLPERSPLQPLCNLGRAGRAAGRSRGAPGKEGNFPAEPPFCWRSAGPGWGGGARRRRDGGKRGAGRVRARGRRPGGPHWLGGSPGGPCSWEAQGVPWGSGAPPPLLWRALRGRAHGGRVRRPPWCPCPAARPLRQVLPG